MPGTVTVDGHPVPIEGERNLLEVVRKAGVDLPTFCYHSELSTYGACRMCMVEDGRGMLHASCSIAPADGMDVKTNTPRVQRIRKMMLELLLANHERDCTVCPKNGSCKLQDLCTRFGVSRVRFPARASLEVRDESTPSLIRDPNKCILCGDCVRMCAEVQGIGAIDFAFRGSKSQVLPAYGKDLGEVDCVNCGQCAAICPTGAITICSEIDEVWNAIRDPKKRVIAQMAPAVRVAIGEEFGQPAGEILTGQTVAAMHHLGFDEVYDTSFTADLTTIEETNEFVDRLVRGERLPLFTSCCPAWVKAVEQYYPEKVEHLSTCRSPQQMFGSVVKQYYARQLGVEPSGIFVVSIMPCTAKKFEAARPEFAAEGVRDVDAVLTTQELARMIKESGLALSRLEEESFDAPFGFATGAGVIFGTTGGVATSVVRTANLMLTGKRTLDVDFQPVDGLDGVRALEAKLDGRTVRVAVVSGLGNARRLVAAMDRGEVAYDIVEVMTCSGGCAGGGGQPIPNETTERQARSRGLRSADRRQQIRIAQDNPLIKEIYHDWLREPNGEVSHKALHTRYTHRSRISGQEMLVMPAPAQAKPLDVKVCVGTSCYLRGSREVLQRLAEEIQARRLGEKVNLGAAFCFENCSRGPTVKVDGVELSGVRPEDVPSLVEKLVEPSVGRSVDSATDCADCRTALTRAPRRPAYP